MTLPFGPLSTTATLPTDPNAAPFALILEPDAPAAALAATALAELGYETAVCTQVIDALMAWQGRPTTLLLCAESLPDMPGHQAIRLLLSNRQTAASPSVVMLGDAASSPFARARAEVAGSHCFLEKPLDTGVLKAAILNLDATHDH